MQATQLLKYSNSMPIIKHTSRVSFTRINKSAGFLLSIGSDGRAHRSTEAHGPSGRALEKATEKKQAKADGRKLPDTSKPLPCGNMEKHEPDMSAKNASDRSLNEISLPGDGRLIPRTHLLPLILTPFTGVFLLFVLYQVASGPIGNSKF